MSAKPLCFLTCYINEINLNIENTALMYTYCNLFFLT